MDESDTVQLASMITKVFQDYMAEQEILTIPQLKGRRRGEELKKFYSCNRHAFK
jgi:hypothetical protein